MKAALWYKQKDIRVEDVIEPQVKDNTVKIKVKWCGICLCSSLGFHGLAGGGGFSEYTTFLSKFVHKIPDTLSYEKAALIEPMSVALHSLRVGSFEIGQSAIVTGAGPIGLATIECLKTAGAKLVIVIQRKSIRQKYALNACADVVLDPGNDDVVAEIKKMYIYYSVPTCYNTSWNTVIGYSEIYRRQEQGNGHYK